MPEPIPPLVPAAETGLPDSQWINDVRDDAGDFPFYVADTRNGDGTNGVIAAGALPFRVSQPRINDGSLSVTVGATAQTVITSGVPGANQVLINYDTGEMIFSAAPGQGVPMAWSYQRVRWRDLSIRKALYAALGEMFPRVGKDYTDVTLRIRANKWDYQLPVWCNAPRSKIFSVEVQDPGIPTEPFRHMPPGSWERRGLGTIHINRSQAYSPTAILRISGWGPYLNLGDLEPQLYHLPIWYALGTIYSKKEGERLRQDTMIPLSQEGGQQPGQLTAAGVNYLRRFDQALNELKRTMTPGWSSPIATVYQRKRYA